MCCKVKAIKPTVLYFAKFLLILSVLFLFAQLVFAEQNYQIQVDPTALNYNLKWGYLGTQASIGIDGNGMPYWQSINNEFFGSTIGITGSPIIPSNDPGWSLFVVKSAGASFGTMGVDFQSGENISFSLATTTQDYAIFKSDSLPSYFLDGFSTLNISGFGSGGASKTFFAFILTNENPSFATQNEWEDYIFDASSNTIDTNIYTRITDIYEPLNGTITSSTTVSFKYDYYIGNEIMDYATIELLDMSSGISMVAPVDTVSANGVSTYDRDVLLTPGHLYQWRPVLNDTVGSQLFGGYNTFEVLTSSASSSPYTPLDPNGNLATSTIVARLFGNQGYLAQKFPFAYFYDVATILRGLNTHDTETSFPSLTLSTASTSIPISFTIFSSTTIVRYSGIAFITVFRTMLSAVFWIGFMLLVYMQVKKLFH